jgi:hypothetical protein
MSSTDLAVSFKETITHLHRRGIELDQELKRVLLEKIETTRSCGVALEAAEADLSKEQWKQLVIDLQIAPEAIKSYLKFASGNPKPVTDFAEAMHVARKAALATGLLPFSDGHGPQQTHKPNWFSSTTNSIQTIAADWKKYLNRHPLSEWAPEQKEQALAMFRPILKIHKAIRDSMQHAV